MKNILITGGLGFVGSYAIETFKALDYNITVIDNMTNNGITDTQGMLLGASQILNCNCDKAVLDTKYDIILHLASPVGPVGILKYAGTMGKIITDDAAWVIELALKHNALLIYYSTSEIYGFRSEDVYLTEDSNKVFVGKYNVRNEYAVGKMLGEIMISNTAKIKDLKYHIIRPFNIAGARQLDTGGFVLPTFVRQALSNKPITVFGDGTQNRAFTHVSEIVDGTVRLSTSTEYGIWNLGAKENRVSILQMANIVKDMTGSTSDIVFTDAKKIHGPLYEEAWDKLPEASKARNLLGWEPSMRVEEIILDVIKYEND